MNKIRLVAQWALFSAAATLVACGGGDDSSSPTATAAPAPAPSSSAPPTTGTPTAALTASQSTASDLVTAGKSGATALGQAGQLNGIPLGVIASPPAGVVNSGTTNCPSGGTYTFSGDFGNTNGTIAVGSHWTATYNNCSYAAGSSLNGTITITYTRYNSATDFAFDIVTSGFTATYNGSSVYGPFDYSAHYDDLNGVFNYSYTVNGSTVVGQPVVVTSGSNVTISSGTVRVNYGSGWVEINYSNWQYDSTTGRPTSGTATITASNGDSAIITVTSTGYTVAVTVGGVTSNYTVAF